jgi:hypothetical protein
MAQKFVIPLVTESVSAFRKLVQENGGPDHFFERLNVSIVDVLSEFNRNTRRSAQLLEESLSDENYRRRVVGSIADDEDREFVEAFFTGWDQWRILYPRLHEMARLLLMGSLRDILLGPITEVVNDVWDCDANVYLDTYREDLYIKSVMKLSHPNKELGGANGWIISSKLDSYLRSIHIMLTALSLRESEIQLIRIPAGKPIIDEILEALEGIGKSLETLRKQFEQMKSP